MIQKVYPRVLIIGSSFNYMDGGGITLSNLFNDFPGSNLKMITSGPELLKCSGEVCSDYYQLGHLEEVDSYLISLFKKRYISGSIIIKSDDERSDINLKVKKKRSKLIRELPIKFIYKILHFSGIFHLIANYKISLQLLQYIKSFNPDIIYTQLSSLHYINLTDQIYEVVKKPLVIHMMDDWPETISKKGLLQKYWKSKINDRFRILINKATTLLSISEEMSNEYKIRYGREFIPFHNPLDLNFWDKSDDKIVKNTDVINFLHAGRIGIGIRNSLLTVAKTLQDINDDNIHVNLYIQSSNIDSNFKRKISKFNCVKINPPAIYNDIPGILKNADVLVLCNDFDRSSKTFLKYSMPTKASEYMISKVPILIFSDCSNAIFKHAKKYKWAFLVGDNRNSVLKEGILELIKNESLRISLSQNAYKYAKSNFDSYIVREKFRNALLSYVGK
jgi:glycosyltransferase involved in cell wall biosynthesis